MYNTEGQHVTAVVCNMSSLYKHGGVRTMPYISCL
jgi:hypothetical protein